MATQQAKCVDGDYTGWCSIHVGFLWFTDPKASKFQGLSFSMPKMKYAPSEIVKLSELRQKPNYSLGSASFFASMITKGATVAAADLLAKNRKIEKMPPVVAVEFADGKKVRFLLDQHDKAYKCFRLYAVERKVVESGFL